MQSDVTRLTHLMDSILACARPMEPKFELLDLCSFVSRLVDRWRPRMSRLNIECYFQAEEALPKVMGDPRTLDQVFTNLISNALDAMTDKGGFLGIKIQQQVVGSRRMVRVSISDTGPGIPSEVIERIFEPFVTTKPSGTGLGLAISKLIITAHHGTLNFETYPTGTIFFVDIPARNGENR
jgi:signal transduction histidine kinase